MLSENKNTCIRCHRACNATTFTFLLSGFSSFDDLNMPGMTTAENER
jgi:hypothetical protein